MSDEKTTKSPIHVSRIYVPVTIVVALVVGAIGSGSTAATAMVKVSNNAERIEAVEKKTDVLSGKREEHELRLQHIEDILNIQTSTLGRIEEKLDRAK